MMLYKICFFSIDDAYNTTCKYFKNLENTEKYNEEKNMFLRITFWF